MDWEKAKTDADTEAILKHWQMLGQFIAKHAAVGVGKHQLISEDNGLVFSRVREGDKIIAGIELPKGKKSINVSPVFKDGLMLRDMYSGKIVNVENSIAVIDSDSDIVLLEKCIVTA